jgi:hypothetical protein
MRSFSRAVLQQGACADASAMQRRRCARLEGVV